MVVAVRIVGILGDLVLKVCQRFVIFEAIEMIETGDDNGILLRTQRDRRDKADNNCTAAHPLQCNCPGCRACEACAALSSKRESSSWKRRISYTPRKGRSAS